MRTRSLLKLFRLLAALFLLTMFRGNAKRNISGVGTVPRVPKLRWRFRTKD